MKHHFSFGNSLSRIVLFGLLISTSVIWARDFTWHPTSGALADRVAVPGDKPLRMGDVNVFLNCLEFGLGVALTDAEIERIRNQFMEEYLQQKSRLLNAVRELKNMWQAITVDNPQETGKYRRIIQDALLEEARRNPTLPLSKSILQLESKSSEIVVPGSPPLTRHSLDAFFEIICFALRLRDKRHPNDDAATLKVWENALIKRFPSLSPEGRRWLSNADFHRAIVMRAWQTTPADEKNTIRALLIATFAPSAADGNGFDIDQIPLPPPNLFPLPADLPWDLR